MVGAATAPLRVDPDYLVIGTKRGGTTSMARWLLQHPDIRPLYPAIERRKGTYFFDVNYGRGHPWYRSHFPVGAIHRRRRGPSGRPRLVGEASPYYLHHPHAPERAHRHAPDARIIALLRNPVDRAHGHWAERHRNGIEHLDFVDALRAEAERLDGEEERMMADPRYVSFAHQHYSYVDQGRYHRGLRRWLETFTRDQVLVLRSEDLYADPGATYRRALDHLGLSPHDLDEFAAWNQKPKDAIDDETRNHLIGELADDVTQLESLLGRSMEWEGFS